MNATDFTANRTGGSRSEACAGPKLFMMTGKWRTIGRGLFAGIALACLDFGAVQAQSPALGPVFSHTDVIAEAERLAASPFVPPPRAPEGLRKLDYAAYSRIRYRKERAIWGRTPSRFSIELFAPGFLYSQGIDISIVENGRVIPTQIDANAFDAPTEEVRQLLAALGKFAGFRLHYPLNRPDYKDEFVVFQGASYFRAVSKGQIYGLSARGLAIDVAEPAGEEFPVFRRFWIERPSSRTENIVVHAILDSKRVAGAFRFGIYPGTATAMDVKMTLFARQPLSHVGIGALTSMYFYGDIDGPDRPDPRPAVHDSLGLAMHSGRGERIWRPLSNPTKLQISAFVDNNPKGFGLIQRERRFSKFEDLKAQYHLRPSAWVAPEGDWGKGHVVLVEIPTKSEGNDNIVAYWRPDSGLKPGVPFTISYMLSWPNDAPATPGVAPVARTAYGLRPRGNQRQIVVDYGPMPGIPSDAIAVDRGLGGGRILGATVEPIPATGGRRIVFDFDPGDAQINEIRVQPRFQDRPVGETMLFRWTRR